MSERHFITGDKHGGAKYYGRAFEKLKLMGVSSDDYLWILGDHGIGIWGREDVKTYLERKAPCKLVFIRGNHDVRVSQMIDNNDVHASKLDFEFVNLGGGYLYHEPKYSKLFYALDGDVYKLNNTYYQVIGGGYSIDKNIIPQTSDRSAGKCYQSCW